MIFKINIWIKTRESLYEIRIVTGVNGQKKRIFQCPEESMKNR